MSLRTLSLTLEKPSRADDWRIGLTDLHRALRSLFFGYLLLLGATLALAALVFFFVVQFQETKPSRKALESASTVLFGGVLLYGLAVLVSVGMILRGKWTCMMSAPERFHARWFMFASFVCIFAGPAMNFTTIVVAESKKPAPASSRSRFQPAVWRETLEESKKGLAGFDTRSYIKLAGNASALLGSAFFVMFLRAMALCCEAPWRARMAEFYLLFTAVLTCGVAVFLIRPEILLDRPQIFIALGLGWLFGIAWYLLLIFNTLVCVGSELGHRSSHSPYATAQRIPT